MDADSERVELPQNQYGSPADTSTEAQPSAPVESESSQVGESVGDQGNAATPKAASQASAVEPRSETPSTQDHPSEDTTSTSPTTPSSVQASRSSTATTATPTKSTKPAARPTIPAIPVIPILPKTSPKDTKPANATGKPAAEVESAPVDAPAETPSKEVNGTVEEASSATSQPAPAPAKPLLWTNLFSKPAPTAANASVTVASNADTNGTVVADASSGAAGTTAGLGKTTANSLVEALQGYRVGGAEKVAFLEPRGLVNTGNMCYMNSVSYAAVTPLIPQC